MGLLFCRGKGALFSHELVCKTGISFPSFPFR